MVAPGCVLTREARDAELRKAFAIFRVPALWLEYQGVPQATESSRVTGERGFCTRRARKVTGVTPASKWDVVVRLVDRGGGQRRRRRAVHRRIPRRRAGQPDGGGAGQLDSGNIAGTKYGADIQPVDFGTVADSFLGVTITREATSHLRVKDHPSDPGQTLTGAIYKVDAAVTKGLWLRASGKQKHSGHTGPISLRYHTGKPSSPYDTQGTRIGSSGNADFDLEGDTSKPLPAGSKYYSRT